MGNSSFRFNVTFRPPSHAPQPPSSSPEKPHPWVPLDAAFFLSPPEKYEYVFIPQKVLQEGLKNSWIMLERGNTNGCKYYCNPDYIPYLSHYKLENWTPVERLKEMIQERWEPILERFSFDTSPPVVEEEKRKTNGQRISYSPSEVHAILLGAASYSTFNSECGYIFQYLLEAAISLAGNKTLLVEHSYKINDTQTYTPDFFRLASISETPQSSEKNSRSPLFFLPIVIDAKLFCNGRECFERYPHIITHQYDSFKPSDVTLSLRKGELRLPVKGAVVIVYLYNSPDAPSFRRTVLFNADRSSCVLAYEISAFYILDALLTRHPRKARRSRFMYRFLQGDSFSLPSREKKAKLRTIRCVLDQLCTTLTNPGEITCFNETIVNQTLTAKNILQAALRDPHASSTLDDIDFKSLFSFLEDIRNKSRAFARSCEEKGNTSSPSQKCSRTSCRL